LFGLVSCLSFQHGQTPGNLGGPGGYGLSSALMQTFGLAAYIFPLLLALLGARLFRSQLEELSVLRAFAAVTLMLSLAVMLGLLLQNNSVVNAGGWFGGFLGGVLRDAWGPLGPFGTAASLWARAVMFPTGPTLGAGATAVAGGTRQAVGSWQARRAAKATAPVILVNRKREPAAASAGPLIVLSEEAEVQP